MEFDNMEKTTEYNYLWDEDFTLLSLESLPLQI
jgi:hypothetical protein